MKRHFLKTLACLVAVLFIGCEKEEHDDHSHEGTLVFEKVNLDEIPSFERQFNADNATYKNKISGNKSGTGSINYFDLIIPEGINSELYDAANNLHYYTFALSIKEKNQLSNLVVKETLGGNEYYVCIFKPENREAWIQSITHYNPNGSVDVETELFELQLLDSYSEKSTTRPCWAETTSWRCPNDVHTAGEGDWLNCETFGAGGDGMARWTSSIHFMQVPCDNGGGGTGGSGTGGSGGDGGSGGGGGSGSGGGSNGSGPVVVQPNVPSQLSVFVSSLGPSQKAWWNSYANAIKKLPMMSYLGQNNYSDASQDFVRGLIEQIILNPNTDLNKSLASPFFIDLSSVSGNSQEEIIFRNVYESLLKSPKFKALFTDLFGSTPLFNVKFVIEDIPQNNTGHTSGTCSLYISGSNPAPFNIISIDRQFLLSKPKINAALVILHECIHAYLNIKFRNPTIGMQINNINDMDFQECINTYYNGFSGNQTQHSFFLEYMLPVMVEILNDVKDEMLTPSQISAVENPQPNSVIYAVTTTMPSVENYNITLPWNWNHYFTHFCTTGLESSIAYPILYPQGSPNLLNRIQYLSIGLFVFTL